MQLRKKITVMIIFSLGLFTLFATLYKTAAELPKLKFEQVDFPRVVGQIILWTIVEASVVIIAGSIPTWGWVFRTERFEKIVSWITLHSFGATRASARLPSRAGETDGESDRVELGLAHESDKERQSGSVALQSIDRIERTAFS